MVYIKKDSTFRWLFYFNQFTPTNGKVIVFKTVKNDTLETKVFTTPNITSRNSYTIYEFQEVALVSEDVELGLLNYANGGEYTLTVYEEDVFNPSPITSPIYTESCFVDIFNQELPSCIEVSPSETIFSNGGANWYSGITVKENGIYVYKNSIYLFVGVDNYVSTDFYSDFNLGFFEQKSECRIYDTAIDYLQNQLIYSSGSLFFVVQNFTSSGVIGDDVTAGNLVEIAGGGGNFLPLAGGSMDANSQINFVDGSANYYNYIDASGLTIIDQSLNKSVYIQTNGIFISNGIYQTSINTDLNPTATVDLTLPQSSGVLATEEYVQAQSGISRQTFTVTDVADLTSLTTANQGDVGIVTSTNESYILTTADYSVLGDWTLILAPDSVISVNGQTGVVNLLPTDILLTVGANGIILVSDGAGGFIESATNITDLVSQAYIDANYLSLNGGIMNIGGSVVFTDGSGTEIIVDAYAIQLTDGFNTSQLLPTKLYFNNGFDTDLQPNPSATQNTVVNLPLTSGTLVVDSEITGIYLKKDGTDGMAGNLNLDSWDINNVATIYATTGDFNNGIVLGGLSLSPNISVIDSTNLINYTTNIAGQTDNTLIHRLYADGRYSPLSHTHILSQILNSDTANKLIITNGTNLVTSSVLATDILTNSSSAITTLQSNVSSLDGRLDTAESDIIVLQSAVSLNSYIINVQHTTTNPVDGETRYFSNRPTIPGTTASQHRIFVDVDCRIIGASIGLEAFSTAGSNEGWSLYIRVNNTTDYLIETEALAQGTRLWTNNTLSIDLVAGDYFTIKSVQPTWATNPVSVVGGGWVRLINL